jgi:hypothetical protein
MGNTDIPFWWLMGWVKFLGAVGNDWYKVVPQCGIAKLVNIAPIMLGFMVDISSYFLWFVDQLRISGAPLCNDRQVLVVKIQNQ